MTDEISALQFDSNQLLMNEQTRILKTNSPSTPIHRRRSNSKMKICNENLDLQTESIQNEEINGINNSLSSLRLEKSPILRMKNIQQLHLENTNNDSNFIESVTSNFNGKERDINSIYKSKSEGETVFGFCKTPEKSSQDLNNKRRSSIYMSFPNLSFEIQSENKPSSLKKNLKEIKPLENFKPVDCTNESTNNDAEHFPTTKKRKASEFDAKNLRQLKRSKRRRKTTFVWDQKENEPSTQENTNIPKTPETDKLSLSFSPVASLTDTPKDIETFGIFFADSEVQYKVTPFQNRKPMGGFLIEDSETPPQSQELPSFPDFSSDLFDSERETKPVSLIDRRRKKFDPYSGIQNTDSFNLKEFLEEKKRKRKILNAQIKAKKYGHAIGGRFQKREEKSSSISLSTHSKSHILTTPPISRKKPKIQRSESQNDLLQSVHSTQSSQSTIPTVHAHSTPISNRISIKDKSKSLLQSSNNQIKSSNETTLSTGPAIATISRLNRLATPKRTITPPKAGPQYCRTLFSPSSHSTNQPIRQTQKSARIEGKVYSKSPSKIFDHLRRKSTSNIKPVTISKDAIPSKLQAPSTKIPDSFRALSEVRVSVNYEKRRQERLIKKLELL